MVFSWTAYSIVFIIRPVLFKALRFFKSFIRHFLNLLDFHVLRFSRYSTFNRYFCWKTMTFDRTGRLIETSEYLLQFSVHVRFTLLISECVKWSPTPLNATFYDLKLFQMFFKSLLTLKIKKTFSTWKCMHSFSNQNSCITGSKNQYYSVSEWQLDMYSSFLNLRQIKYFSFSVHIPHERSSLYYI